MSHTVVGEEEEYVLAVTGEACVQTSWANSFHGGKRLGLRYGSKDSDTVERGRVLSPAACGGDASIRCV